MEIRIPEVGESVVEAVVAKWFKGEGERVEKDDPLCEIETDKITMELNAGISGLLSRKAAEGETVKIGAVIGEIREIAPQVESDETGPEPKRPQVARHLSPSERKAAREAEAKHPGKGRKGEREKKSPSVKQVPLFPERVGSEEEPSYDATHSPAEGEDYRRRTRRPMTPIRRRIAERLLEARQQTAMLTTFNEADMGRVLELRESHAAEFQKRHGVPLGIMSFFIKACVEALEEFPEVNAQIDGNDIVYHHFCDIGIAVSGEKGLVVPVMRNAERLRFFEMEKGIRDFVDRVKNNRIALSDLEGGTFTISNGGVFGSLLSTPIINPPQSGVLGMHAIQERPVARDGKVVIRPMMYLALSYDHRIIDGREAVHFLGKVIEYVENPEEMLLEG